jgi:glucose-1-phosphate cytidylyltransferase
MEVVLFCGGYGMRMRDGVSDVPEPMQTVGPRPLLRHVMRYYAHFGHTDFVLCLGYGAEHVEDYFLNYSETGSNDLVLRRGEVEVLGSDIADWTITFVHTGVDSSIGERLRRVRRHVADEELFPADYADVLTDAPLDVMVSRFRRSDAVAALLAVPPQAAFHCVGIGDDDRVTAVPGLRDLPIRENGGYVVLRPEIVDHIPRGRVPRGGRVRRPGRGPGGCWRTATAAPGSPPTRPRSAWRWRPPTGTGRGPGCSGSSRTGTRWRPPPTASGWVRPGEADVPGAGRDAPRPRGPVPDGGAAGRAGGLSRPRRP